MTPTQSVLYELRDGIAEITINRPDKLNAVDRGAVAGLFDAWRRFEADGAARVAILTGAGERAFCVGRDLSEPATGDFDIRSIPVIDVSVDVTKPTIAAVNGMAIGGGFLFAQMCDLCVASENATFAITEARLGRGAAWAAPLAAVLPPRVLMEMLLTGAPMPARDLQQHGFVNRLVPAARLMPEARALAAAVAANAPLALRACRRMVRDAVAEAAERTSGESAALFRAVYESEDAAEGIRAFRDKRAPRWIGR